MKIVEPAGARRTVASFVTAVLAASVLAAILPAAAANADDTESAPPRDPITVTATTVNGTGCPVNTKNAAKVVAEPDNTGFRIFYSAFNAQSGTTSPSAIRRNCLVTVQVEVPQGFTYALARADYRGQISLSSGATALERTSYWFQGDPHTAFLDHVFTGPVNGRWRTSDSADIYTSVWAPCGSVANLSVNTELRVNSPSPNNWISLVSSSTDVDTLVRFRWREC